MKCNYHKIMKDQGTFCSFCLTWESFNTFTLFFSMYTLKKNSETAVLKMATRAIKKGLSLQVAILIQRQDDYQRILSKASQRCVCLCDEWCRLVDRQSLLALIAGSATHSFVNLNKFCSLSEPTL